MYYFQFSTQHILSTSKYNSTYSFALKSSSTLIVMHYFNKHDSILPLKGHIPQCHSFFYITSSYHSLPSKHSSQSQWLILVPLLQLMVVIDCEIRSQLIDQAPLNQFGIHCREKKNIAVKKCTMRDCTHSCLRYEITEDHQNVSKICNRYVEITLKSNIEQ